MAKVTAGMIDGLNEFFSTIPFLLIPVVYIFREFHAVDFRYIILHSFHPICLLSAFGYRMSLPRLSRSRMWRVSGRTDTGGTALYGLLDV